MTAAFAAIHAYAGDVLRCPVCGRPHRDFELRAGDAWLRCWNRKCGRLAWAVRVQASEPKRADVCAAVGERLGSAVLLSHRPGMLVVVAVPDGLVMSLRTASHAQIIHEITTDLVGWQGDLVPAIRLPDRAGFSSAEISGPTTTEE